MNTANHFLAPWAPVRYHRTWIDVLIEMVTSNTFFNSLRGEMALRARLLLSGGGGKAGRMMPDDLVQEALAKLLTAYGEESLCSREHNSLMALAYRTMRNLVIDQGRKKGAYLVGDDEENERRTLQTVDSAPLADELTEQGTRALLVREALKGLEPAERCFILHVLETDSVPSAQKHCGWPPKSPYYQLRRLMDGLRDALTPILGGGRA